MSARTSFCNIGYCTHFQMIDVVADDPNLWCRQEIVVFTILLFCTIKNILKTKLIYRIQLAIAFQL